MNPLIHCDLMKPSDEYDRFPGDIETKMFWSGAGHATLTKSLERHVTEAGNISARALFYDCYVSHGEFDSDGEWDEHRRTVHHRAYCYQEARRFILDTLRSCGFTSDEDPIKPEKWDTYDYR